MEIPEHLRKKFKFCSAPPPPEFLPKPLPDPHGYQKILMEQLRNGQPFSLEGHIVEEERNDT